MTTRLLSGRVSKLSANSGGLIFFIGKDDESLSLSVIERNYNAMASALFIATANNFEVSVKTDVDGRSVQLLTVEA